MLGYFNLKTNRAKGLIVFIAFLLFSTSKLYAAPDGKALFQANCAACHNPYKDATGPALFGVDTRVPSKEWLHKWVKNSMELVASGDKHANDVFNKWNKIPMPPFPALTEEEVDAIIAFVNIPKPEPKQPAVTASKQPAGDTDNTLLYAILTVILLVVVAVFTSINKALSKAAREKAGLPSPKDIPSYRNKVVISIVAVVLILSFGAWLTNASEFGRQKNYMPKQPIFYSHKVHAGINQINCLYCHTGAEKGRIASVPSTNVCMNCHKQINEYTGAEDHPLISLEGDKIDGTAQIQELYKYAGWDKDKKAYKTDAKGNILATPIPWVKIHNLPDHVYFNHSLHVVSGKIACQRCHGNVEEMDEVFQSQDLSMGWCVNCHRNTNVQFANNDYYSIFQKYHDEIKAGTRTDVKVSDIGGLECQKCHY